MKGAKRKKMGIREEIVDRLEAAFGPSHLEVVDESEQHRGHAGWREGGSTHFRVRMTAQDLGPMTRVGRHRAVHGALGKDLIDRIHALALEVSG